METRNVSIFMIFLTIPDLGPCPGPGGSLHHAPRRLRVRTAVARPLVPTALGPDGDRRGLSERHPDRQCALGTGK